MVFCGNLHPEIRVMKTEASHSKYIYSQQPKLIYWEVTTACDLACKHCRASAQVARSPYELRKEEALQLVEAIRSFGDPAPHLVITGGDPLKYPYLFDIIDKAISIGVGVSLSPSATPNLSRDAIKKIKESGVQAISLSLDGASAETHDAFRGEKGCFDMTFEAIKNANEFGLPVQINSLVAENTVNELPIIFEKLKTMNILRWSVFFLISVGRGTALQEVSPEKAVEIMNWLDQCQKEVKFPIKTTEAPHYRRLAIENMRKSGKKVPLSELPVSRGFGIRDGNGIMFISNTGNVFPSGFLPAKAGNVRVTNVVEIYRDSEIFKNLRKPDEFKGKCGVCEFRYVCGGSRARAYIHSGDVMESDMLCDYQPKKWLNKQIVV